MSSSPQVGDIWLRAEVVERIEAGSRRNFAPLLIAHVAVFYTFKVTRVTPKGMWLESHGFVPSHLWGRT